MDNGDKKKLWRTVHIYQRCSALRKDNLSKILILINFLLFFFFFGGHL